MSEKPESDKSVDLLGIKPVGEAALVLTQGTVSGASAFLSRICLPAAEEFGFLLRDKVASWREHSEWRRKQAEHLLLKTEEKLTKRPNFERLRAHPRLAKIVLEHGSWTDCDELHDLWSGLLSSACSEDPDDTNLSFMNIMAQMTTSQARLLNIFFNNSEFFVTRSGWVWGDLKLYSRAAILKASGLTDDDWHIIDYQLDTLRQWGLTQSGLGSQNDFAGGGLSPFGIGFYLRCQGWVGAPKEYFAKLPERSFAEMTVDNLIFYDVFNSDEPLEAKDFKAGTVKAIL